MAKTAAATTTALDALPATTVATGDSSHPNTVVVSVELTFDRVNFDPEELRDALDDKYATVTSDVDGAERPMGPFRFRISA